jgi:Fe2+ transport system protein FeoA
MFKTGSTIQENGRHGNGIEVGKTYRVSKCCKNDSCTCSQQYLTRISSLGLHVGAKAEVIAVFGENVLLKVPGMSSSIAIDKKQAEVVLKSVDNSSLHS